jgi:N-acetylmuramoyl-L-alanine amidase
MNAFHAKISTKRQAKGSSVNLIHILGLNPVFYGIIISQIILWPCRSYASFNQTQRINHLRKEIELSKTKLNPIEKTSLLSSLANTPPETPDSPPETPDSPPETPDSPPETPDSSPETPDSPPETPDSSPPEASDTLSESKIADFDGDLLLNAEELILGTDPYNPDTDHDGLTDHDEIYLSHTSPIQIDSNQNGVSDYNEFYGNFTVKVRAEQESPYDYDGDSIPDPIDPAPHSSINIPDSDGDSLLDSEDTHPLDPTRWRDVDESGTNDDAETPGADMDNDGVSNATDSHPEDPTLINDWNANGINDPHEDWDGDSVSNLQDSHPNANHLWCDWNSNGINDDAEAGKRDNDDDGHSDATDSHPWNSQLWEDWNGNGTNDSQDKVSRPETKIADTDHDGYSDISDSHPLNKSLWEDWNQDGWNDSVKKGTDTTDDQDRDGDSYCNTNDTDPSNPLLWNDQNQNGLNDETESAFLDGDGDGSTDAYDTHPQDPRRWNDRNDNGTNDSQEVTITDSDQDGYANESDTHPTNPKLWNDHNQDGTNDESQAPPDSDQDGLSDSTDPLPQDTDNDGLTNQEENSQGTHPNNPDTDGDGLTDGLEIYTGTDPGHVDTDSDGLSDTEELIAYHTDPTEPTGVSSDHAEEDATREKGSPEKPSYPASGEAKLYQKTGTPPADTTPSAKESLTTTSSSSPPLSLTLEIPGIMTGSLKKILLPNGAFLSFPSSSGTPNKSDLSKKIILTNLSETQTLNGFYISFSGADVNQFTANPPNLTRGLAPGASVELTITFKAPTPATTARFATLSISATGTAQPLHSLQLRSIVSAGIWQTHKDTFYADFTDSDDDGIPDRVELMYEPLVITPDGDLDGNGISNLAQYQAGLDLRGNAHASDLDADGLSDNLENAWGKVYFGSINKARFADAYEDPDGDGLLTIEELNGTWGNAAEPAGALRTFTNPFTAASGPTSAASNATLYFSASRPVPDLWDFSKLWSWYGLWADYDAWLDDGLLRLAAKEARQLNGQPFTTAQFYAPALIYPPASPSPNTATFAPGHAHLPTGYIRWLRSKGITQLPEIPAPTFMWLPPPNEHSAHILEMLRARLRPVTDADHDGLPTDWEAAQKLGNETASELNWRNAADSRLHDAQTILDREITTLQQQMHANSIAIAALTGSTSAVNSQRAALERENLRLDHERMASVRVLDQLSTSSTEPLVEHHRIASTGTNTALILPYAIATPAFPAASRLTATSTLEVRTLWITEHASARAWQILQALDPDHDGLINADEYALGLSPRLPDYSPTGDRDSDGDGIHDVTENFMGTNPLLASSFPPFKITLVSGGAQSGQIHQLLDRPIVFQATYNGTLRKAGLDLTTPIPGLPIRVSSSHGNATLVATLPSGINASLPIPSDQLPTPDAWLPAGLTPTTTLLPTDAQGRLTLALKLPYAATNTTTVLTAASVLNANFKASASATLSRPASDTDGDGMPNAWEVQPASAGRPAHSLNPNSPLDADAGPQHFGYHRDTPLAKLPATIQTVLTSLLGSDGFLIDYPVSPAATWTNLAIPANTTAAIANARNAILARIDPDHDGRSSLEEFTNDTHPKIPDYPDTLDRDSDGDGYDNGFEVRLGSNHLLASSKPSPTADVDGDGLTFAQEMNTYLTDPANPDTDSDGFNDGWEARYFNPKINNLTDTDLTNDPSADPDGDTLNNQQEERINTNPRNRDTDQDGDEDDDEYRAGSNPLDNKSTVANPGGVARGSTGGSDSGESPPSFVPDAPIVPLNVYCDARTPSGVRIPGKYSVTLLDSNNNASYFFEFQTVSNVNIPPWIATDRAYPNIGTTSAITLYLKAGTRYRVLLSFLGLNVGQSTYYFRNIDHIQCSIHFSNPYSISGSGILMDAPEQLNVPVRPATKLNPPHPMQTSFDLYLPWLQSIALVDVPSNRSRTRLGVGEQTWIIAKPLGMRAPFLSGNVGNSAFAAHPSGMHLLTAGDVACTPSVSLALWQYSRSLVFWESFEVTPFSYPISSIANQTHTRIFTVVEPTSETATKVKDLGYPEGTQGAGMNLEVTVQPKDVSFYNVQMREVDLGTTGVTGVFQNMNPSRLIHEPNPNWINLSKDNKWTDNAEFFGFVKSEWGEGKYEWPIGVEWRVGTKGVPRTLPTTRHQIHTMLDSSGSSKISKSFGTTPTLETTRKLPPLPIEVVELSPKLRDADNNEIAGSEVPKKLPESNSMVEEAPNTNRIAHREMKVKVGSALKDKKITWTMDAKFTPEGQSQPSFRGDWASAAATHRDRFETSTAYGAHAYRRISQEQAETTVDADGFTAIRVNVPPIGFNKARIKIQIEGTTPPVELIDLDVQAVVVIDPGHGGTPDTDFMNSTWNNSTSPSGVLEKTMALSYGSELKTSLEAHAQAQRLNLKVLMTRTTDVSVNSRNRANIARDNGADQIFIIHFNAFTDDDGVAPDRSHTVRGSLEVRQNPNLAGSLPEDIAFIDTVLDRMVPVMQAFDAGANRRGHFIKDTTVATDTYLGNEANYHPVRAGYCEVEFIDFGKQTPNDQTDDAVDILLNTGPNAGAVRTAIANAMRDGIIQDLRTQPAP